MSDVTWKKLGRIEWAAFVDGKQVATVWSAGVQSRGSRSLNSNSWRVYLVDGPTFTTKTREKAAESITRWLAKAA